jgi:WD40 repeat protein
MCIQTPASLLLVALNQHKHCIRCTGYSGRVSLQGVLGMSWCPQDHSLLLSCSKDNRTICWDVATTDVVCELPSSGNWNFDVQVRCLDVLLLLLLLLLALLCACESNRQFSKNVARLWQQMHSS